MNYGRKVSGAMVCYKKTFFSIQVQGNQENPPLSNKCKSFKEVVTGYSNKEKEEFKIKVFQNIFKSMATMISEMEILKIQYKDPDSQVGLF
jgi:hypothetical protein